MTTTFQPGQHPDADQLNAFVEHVLPLHEQQAMLAHLAVCPDCRAIAYLAQPPAPEHLPHPAPAHTPLFARWMILWPTAAALACLIVLTIHVHNLDVARDKTAANTAHLDQTPPHAPEPETPPSPDPAQVQPPPKQSVPSTQAPKTKSAPPPTVVPLNGLSRNHVTPAYSGAAALPKAAMKDASDTPAEKKSPSPISVGAISLASPQSAAPALPPPSPGSSFHGSALRSAATQYDMGRAQTQQAAPRPPAVPPPSNSGDSGIYGGTGSSNLNAAYVAAAPAPTDSPQAAAANATAVDTLTAEFTTASAFKAKPLPRLPSKLPARSVATSASYHLAIDTAGTLFRSEDAGVTWQPVAAQWTGHATKVVFLPSPNARQFGKTLGALSPPPAAKAASPQPPYFQLITDTGHLWTSPDGQTWKQK